MNGAPVIVIGSGGHAAEVCSYVEQLAKASGAARLLGCVDDHVALGIAGELTLLGNIRHLAELMRLHGDLRGITATGDNVLRRLMVARAEAIAGGPVSWWTLVHPHASVGTHVEIGVGTCLAPGSIVTTRSRIGRHCVLNVKASVSHDATIGDYVNLNPGVVISGNVRIGDGCYIGAGATVIDKVTIGQGTVVGAGAVVVEDLPANTTAVGVPARVIKYHAGTWEPALVARRA
jgi:acetyltransferase EpsM